MKERTGGRQRYGMAIRNKREEGPKKVGRGVWKNGIGGDTIKGIIKRRRHSGSGGKGTKMARVGMESYGYLIEISWQG